MINTFKILQKILKPKKNIAFIITSLAQSSILNSPIQKPHFLQTFNQTNLSHFKSPNFYRKLDKELDFSEPFDEQNPTNQISVEKLIKEVKNAEEKDETVNFLGKSGVKPHFYRKLDKEIDFSGPFEKCSPNDQFGVEKLIKAVTIAEKNSSVDETLNFLEESCVEPSEELVFRVIWELKEEWELALLVFKWGEKRGCLGENVWALMVWMLGNCKKFSMAWCLIKDMYRSSIDTRRAMHIMIDRYTASNDPSKAIYAFELMEKFSTTLDIESLHTLLSSLCKWGYIEEAEQFMLSRKNFFPLETVSFNIILNGWCNISVDVFEAKRIWREMAKHCILPNGNSYTLMISCFSKVGNLFDSLRLYDEMKKEGWTPFLEVYNSLVYVLTRENCLEQAMRILVKMKEESVRPNSSTYDSMIGPLCEATKLDETRKILATMIEDNIEPTLETYHSLVKAVSMEESIEILNYMKKAGLGPTKDTFHLIFVKLFKMKQPDIALKLRDEMKRFEIEVDYRHYCVLVEGLASNGLLIKARELYDEMKMNGFPDDPKLNKLVNVLAPNTSHINKKVPFRVMRAIKKDTHLQPEKSSKISRRRRRKKPRNTSNVI